jgi:serine/threonine protein kinase
MSMHLQQYAMLCQATVTAAKTMKGTPHWMAPEVIVGSGHSLYVWKLFHYLVSCFSGFKYDTFFPSSIMVYQEYHFFKRKL